MADPLLAFLIKLPLALAVFLLIAYAGSVSRRIAGVLLTFPILNGIAVIAGADPIAVADAIYPLVIFNCVLFALLISFPRLLPVGALPHWFALLIRVLAWSALWFAGAYLLTDARQHIFGAGTLFAGASILALVFMTFFWSGPTASAEAARTTMSHQTRFVSFWLNATGLLRIVFFALAYGCLFWVSRAALDEKWVGMASALPLPGFFALAVLIRNAEQFATSPDNSALLPMRDTVFLGPILVIPFNWAFSHLIVFVPNTRPRYLLLFALWSLAACAVLLLVPRIAAHFDRRS
jgi:hypothetical protein